MYFRTNVLRIRNIFPIFATETDLLPNGVRQLR